jgi:hypothetical protein
VDESHQCKCNQCGKDFSAAIAVPSGSTDSSSNPLQHNEGNYNDIKN